MKTMLHIASLKLFLLLILFSSWSPIQAVQSNFYIVPFYAPGEGPFVEAYLTVMGYSAQFKPVTDDKKQASIEITYLFKQAGEIKKFHKVVLKSPEIAITDSLFPNFMDIARIPIENGLYDLEVKIRDLNNENSFFTTTTTLRVDITAGQLASSGLEWIERYQPSTSEGPLVKSGFELTKVELLGA